MKLLFSLQICFCRLFSWLISWSFSLWNIRTFWRIHMAFLKKICPTNSPNTPSWNQQMVDIFARRVTETIVVFDWLVIQLTVAALVHNMKFVLSTQIQEMLVLSWILLTLRFWNTKNRDKLWMIVWSIKLKHSGKSIIFAQIRCTVLVDCVDFSPLSMVRRSSNWSSSFIPPSDYIIRFSHP